MSENNTILPICIFLSAAAIAVFWQLNNADFINCDDTIYVTQNSTIQHGITIEGIRWAFTTGHAANWHPATWISHMLDVQLFGLRPRWHHLTNLVFHIVNTLLLFLLLFRMTKALWKSAFVAALFALHPLHVESVAWVAERKDVLSAFFWMLTLGAYCRYVERPGLQRYLVVVLFFIAGLMAKPMLVTLPFVLLLLDYWPFRRFPKTGSDQRDWDAGMIPVSKVRPLLMEKVPLFVLATLSGIVTYIVQQRGGAVESGEALSRTARMANTLVSYVNYIGATIWPAGLAVLYPHPRSLPAIQVVGSLLLLTAITAAVFTKVKRMPYLAAGWLWYVITLVPVIGMVQVGIQARADRYTYLPLIGLFIMAVWGFSELSKNWLHRKKMLITSSTIMLLSLSVVTENQVRYWQNSITLFDHALNVTVDNYLAYNNRGVAYRDQGNGEKALADFDRALAINPNYADAHNNRGLVLAERGDDKRAIRSYDRAIGIRPKFAEAYYNRGISLRHLGMGDRAFEDFSRAIEINPGYVKAYLNRGAVFVDRGSEAQAVGEYDKAISINPKYAEAYFQRAYVYWRMNNAGAALEDLRTAARLGYEKASAALRSAGIQ
jgi:tetratricopeptide (TPR) repeat protein